MANDIWSAFSGLVPSGATVMTIIYICIGVLVLVGLGGLCIWLFIDKKRHNKRIHLWKIINGKMEEIGVFPAMFQRIGLAGDYWCKVKIPGGKTIPRPMIAFKRDHYNMFEREDGEWFNFRIENMDEVMREANVFYSHEDMRMSRLAIESNMQKRYEKKNLLLQALPILSAVFVVIVCAVVIIIILNKFGQVAPLLSDAASALKGAALALKDTTVQQTSGLVPASGVPL